MKSFEAWPARLNPAEASEMRKTRPVVILSPDEMNEGSNTVLVAPFRFAASSRELREKSRWTAFAASQATGRCENPSDRHPEPSPTVV